MCPVDGLGKASVCGFRKSGLHNYMSFYDEDAKDVILGEGVNFMLERTILARLLLFAMALANLKRNAHTSLHSFVRLW